jgi:FkbM family methyltransferase
MAGPGTIIAATSGISLLTMSALRRFLGLPWILPLTALLLRAWTVRPAVRFALREMLRVSVTRSYRLRAGDLRVTVRHRTADVVTLGEVFHDNAYVPDAEIAAALGHPDVIVDLGANIGLFGAFAAVRWPSAQITAFEPDPDNLSVHARTIAANGLAVRWRLVPAAAGATDGEARFASGLASLSRLAGAAAADAGEDLITVPVRDVLPLLADADLLKMDIEGGEWAILGDSRFRAHPPRVVVLEYHPHLCPGPDPRAAAETLLAAAGLTVREIKVVDGGYGMLWAWRR